MPNLVGIGNSQVPTNAMLGGLAYQDPAHANLTEVEIEKIAAIKSKLSETAVDIFVYDTRKDSDGGAWRKRTQHTSWYNELPSVQRGIRKEFPAVAVLVVRDVDPGYGLTIYDGDDPNLPMWMDYPKDTTQDPFFDYSDNGSTHMGNYSPTSVSALNGIICVGTYRSAGALSNLNAGIRQFHFIEDACYAINDDKTVKFPTRIVDRTVTTPTYWNHSANAIVNVNVLDVAMTVLPNAPIDSASGLPTPTIAVATDGGVSVIKDDGTIVDITSGTIIHHEPRNINFLGTRLLWTEGNNYDLQDRAFLNVEVPSADIVLPHTGSLPRGYIGYGIGSGASAVFNNFSLLLPLNNELSSPARERKFQISGPDNTIVFGCKHAVYGGLELIHQNTSTPANGMVAVATTSYNTGWMHGDCKLAALCDTDTTNLSGSNLMSGAEYNTSDRIDSYSYSNGSSTLVISDEQATSDGYVNLTLTGLTASTTYVMTATANQAYTPTTGYNHHVGNTGDGAVYFEDNFVGTTTLQKITFKTAASGNPTVVFYSGYNGALTYTMDLRLAEFDRSNGHFSSYNSAQTATNKRKDGIGVYGTITKSAVATGAELVGYSGFSASNYLTYNAEEMDFGTGDFSVSVWAIPSTDTTNEFILELDDSSEGSNRFYLLVTNTAKKRIYVPWDSDVSGSDLTPGMWNHIVAGRSSGVGYVYVNGRSISDGTDAWTTSLNGNGQGTIGNYSGGPSADYAWSGSLALLRISGSMPTAEQVKKMYNDEKHLFQENAKCTLYGSSSAVTAIAYDDSNDIVNVGTSSGRSDFVGLNRINNTTTAVTTAISASDALVAEQ